MMCSTQVVQEKVCVHVGREREHSDKEKVMWMSFVFLSVYYWVNSKFFLNKI